VAGWALGLKAGRALVTAPGPLRSARLRALDRGREIFTRHPVLAIYATPSWVSGILRVPAPLYMTVNALTALAWAAVVGLGGYYAGPPIVDVVSDLGTVAEIALVVIVVATVGAEAIRRRRGTTGAAGH
jgi:membrane protein DedA with SNARE-associated domain